MDVITAGAATQSSSDIHRVMAPASDGHQDGAVAVDLDREAASRRRNNDGIVSGDDQARHENILVGDGTTCR